VRLQAVRHGKEQRVFFSAPAAAMLPIAARVF